MAEQVLAIDRLTMQFGGVVAVNNLNMHIGRGEIVALIGPNGAGKTTAFNCVTGVYRPTNGRIVYENETIIQNHPAGNMKKLYAGGDADAFRGRAIAPTPDRITRRGIARTFQNIRLFKTQTVLENVLVATHMRRKAGILSAMLHLDRAEERAMEQKALGLLDTVGLLGVKDEKAASLPYGSQRRLEIARALATDPRLLLLDEPAAGMNPQETEELSAFIRFIRDTFSLTVFLIEHHMELVMDISDRVYVIDFGRLIAEGTPSQVQDDPGVVQAYLGAQEEEPC